MQFVILKLAGHTLHLFHNTLLLHIAFALWFRLIHWFTICIVNTAPWVATKPPGLALHGPDLHLVLYFFSHWGTFHPTLFLSYSQKIVSQRHDKDPWVILLLCHRRVIVTNCLSYRTRDLALHDVPFVPWRCNTIGKLHLLPSIIWIAMTLIF